MEHAPEKYYLEEGKPIKRRERIIRYSSIIVIGIAFPLIYRDYDFFSSEFFWSALVSIISVALFWIGSEHIVTFIIHKFDFFKHTAKTITLLVISLILYSLSVILLEDYVLSKITNSYGMKENKLELIILAILITLFITTIYMSTFFFMKWKENLIKAEKLEKATLEAQYEALKNQINPHFLFNSLNTLTGMLEEDSKPMSYVQNLSDFLRYLLQNSDKELVLLCDEIQLATQYAFIQQIRFDKKLTIDFDIPESAYHFAIPPLSLQMLIENAIKHNIISKENPLHISVFINHQNMLIVENNLQRKAIESSTGLGLENIRNRYKFIGAYNIDVSETTNKFAVGLPLMKVSL